MWWVVVYSKTDSWLMSLPKPLPLIPPCGASETIGKWSFIQVTPAWIFLESSSALPTSVVQIEEANPYSLSLANKIASSSSLIEVIVITGPKTSVAIIELFCLTLVNNVGG